MDAARARPDISTPGTKDVTLVIHAQLSGALRRKNKTNDSLKYLAFRCLRGGRMFAGAPRGAVTSWPSPLPAMHVALSVVQSPPVLDMP
jgi:hypothetical protein